MAEASPESDYFALMDADDIALPERFEKQLEYLEAHPELAAVGSSIWIVDEESRRDRAGATIRPIRAGLRRR